MDRSTELAESLLIWIKSMKAFALVLMAVFTLASCVSVPKQSAWPNDIPAYSFYIDKYHSDLDNQHQQRLDEYLKWVIGFYYGTELYSNGWLRVTQEAIEAIEDPAERALARNKLDWIGQHVSAEWAKSNALRVINSRHVSIWALSLDEAIARGEALSYIDEVVRDIDAILAGLIEPDDITDYRYFTESEDFFF